MADYDFMILTDDDGASEEEIAFQGLNAIEAAIGMNLMYLRRHPDAVCGLVCGEVKYDSAKRDVLSLVGEIRTIPRLLRAGKGLCIDIVAYDVAIRRFEGHDAWPKIIAKGDGAFFHVVTEVPGPDGQDVEIDPSEELEQLGYAVNGQPDQCNACVDHHGN